MAVFIGVDVCKKYLDFAVLEGRDNWLIKHERVANNPQGVAAIGRVVAEHNVSLVVCESTGGMEDLLVASTMPVARVSPEKILYFAIGTGCRAKTDRLDAQSIARFAEYKRPQLTPRPSEFECEFAETVKHRARQVVEITAIKNRLPHAKSAFVVKESKRKLRNATNALARIEKRISVLAASNEDCAKRMARLRSAPGVGPVLSSVLAAFMPELGTITGRQAAALIGIAPFANDSGEEKPSSSTKKRGTKKRQCSGGRSNIRSVLYMATVTAVQYEPHLKALLQRLVAKGKPWKVVVTACARKLIVMLNAMCRDQCDYKAKAVE